MSKDTKGSWPKRLLDKRQVIPRWRSPADAAHAGEQAGYLHSAHPRSLPRRWEVLLAPDLDHEDAHEAVERAEFAYLLRGDDHGAMQDARTEGVRRLWQDAAGIAIQPSAPLELGDNWRQHDQQTVRSLRASLKVHPGQPLLWAELSRAYVMLGEDERAAKSMDCALQLAGSNTYITRSAARLFMHVDAMDKALAIVRRHPNVRRDPRLLCAEVALSSVMGMSSLHAKLAAHVLKDSKYRPAHTTDLAAALATVELENGKHRQARQLFEQSFNGLSENALAQAQWASERDSKIVIPLEAWRTPASHEAIALASRARKDWDEVLTATEHWLADERFAIRPAMVGSFALFTDEQCVRSERLATACLQTNPGHIGLLNNRAVARAYLGRLEDALEDIQGAVQLGGKDDPYLIATLGLVAYRSGHVALGAQCYGTATAQFVKQKDRPTLALAILFWIRELARSGSPHAAEDFQYIKRHLRPILQGRREPDIESMLELIERELASPPMFSLSAASIEPERLQQTFARFTPDRAIVSLRNRFLESVSA